MIKGKIAKITARDGVTPMDLHLWLQSITMNHLVEIGENAVIIFGNVESDVFLITTPVEDFQKIKNGVMLITKTSIYTIKTKGGTK